MKVKLWRSFGELVCFQSCMFFAFWRGRREREPPETVAWSEGGSEQEPPGRGKPGDGDPERSLWEGGTRGVGGHQ